MSNFRIIVVYAIKVRLKKRNAWKRDKHKVWAPGGIPNGRSTYVVSATHRSQAIAERATGRRRLLQIMWKPGFTLDAKLLT